MRQYSNEAMNFAQEKEKLKGRNAPRRGKLKALRSFILKTRSLDVFPHCMLTTRDARCNLRRRVVSRLIHLSSYAIVCCLSFIVANMIDEPLDRYFGHLQVRQPRNSVLVSHLHHASIMVNYGQLCSDCLSR